MGSAGRLRSASSSRPISGGPSAPGAKRPRTPAQRLLDDPAVGPHLKSRVRALLAAHDPLDLRDRVEAGLARLARLMARTPAAEPPRDRASSAAGSARPPRRPQGPQRPLEPC